MATYYLDTCIWLDLYERRGRNGKWAWLLIRKSFRDRTTILFSDLHIQELRGLGYTIDEIHSIFKIAKPLLEHVHIREEQKEECRRHVQKRSLPRIDCLHALLARDNNAILVSRDRDFEQMHYIVETKRPSDMLQT